MHVITWASTFIHSYEENSWLHFEYAKRSTIFIARDEMNEYWIKAPLKSYKVHPEYIKHPGLYGGFDISVATFEMQDAKSFIKELSTFKNMLKKLVPSIPNLPKIKKKEQVFLTGYPGENGGTMFQMKTDIYDFISTEDNTCMIVLKDLKTSGGLTGSPILKIDENKTELIGVYVGYDGSTCVEIWTIVNNWVMDVINERLILQDLKKKSKFSKNKHHKRKIELDKRSEQGQLSEVMQDEKYQDILGELENDFHVGNEMDYTKF